MAHFQIKIQLSGYSAYPEGSPSQLIRVSAVQLYSYHTDYVQEDQLCNKSVGDFSEARYVQVQTNGYQSTYCNISTGTSHHNFKSLIFTSLVRLCIFARLGTTVTLVHTSACVFRFNSRSRLTQFVIGMSAADLASS